MLLEIVNEQPGKNQISDIPIRGLATIHNVLPEDALLQCQELEISNWIWQLHYNFTMFI